MNEAPVRANKIVAQTYQTDTGGYAHVTQHAAQVRPRKLLAVSCNIISRAYEGVGAKAEHVAQHA